MLRYVEYDLDGERYGALEVVPNGFACILPMGQPTLEVAQRFRANNQPKRDPDSGLTTGIILIAWRHLMAMKLAGQMTKFTVVDLEK